MSGTVLYELHMHGENMFLLAVVLALFGIPLGCFMWSLHTAGSHKRSSQIYRRFAVPLVMAFAAVLLVYGAVLKDYMALKSQYDSGNCRQVEGVVTEYQQGPNGRQTYEVFAVSGICFYNENMPENLPGYCLTGDTGAVLKSVITGDGQRLRVTYVSDWPYQDGTINAIVRIEELPEQAGAA